MHDDATLAASNEVALGLRAMLAATQDAQRAYRRLALERDTHPAIDATATRLSTAAQELYRAERTIASALALMHDEDDEVEAAMFWWTLPATRQAEVLSVIHELGEASAPEIGKRLGLHRSRVINICHRLARRGHIRARQDPSYRGRRLLFTAVGSASHIATT